MKLYLAYRFTGADKQLLKKLLTEVSENLALLGLETGYAKAKGKKIFLAKKKGIEADYLESLSDKTTLFDEEIPTKENLTELLSCD